MLICLEAMGFALVAVALGHVMKIILICSVQWFARTCGVMLLGIMKREFRFIEGVGAVLGFVIGLAQLGILWLM